MINKFRLDLQKCGADGPFGDIALRLGDIAGAFRELADSFCELAQAFSDIAKTFRDVAEELHYFEKPCIKVKAAWRKWRRRFANWENVFANSRKRSAISRNYSANSPEDGSISPNRFAISQNGGGGRVPAWPHPAMSENQSRAGKVCVDLRQYQNETSATRCGGDAPHVLQRSHLTETPPAWHSRPGALSSTLKAYGLVMR